jgi:hypothetical protein
LTLTIVATTRIRSHAVRRHYKFNTASLGNHAQPHETMFLNARDFNNCYLSTQADNNNVSYLDDGAAAVYNSTTANMAGQYLPEQAHQCRSDIRILSSLIAASANSNSNGTGSASKRAVRVLHNAVQAVLDEHAAEVWGCNDINTTAATALLLNEQ